MPYARIRKPDGNSSRATSPLSDGTYFVNSIYLSLLPFPKPWKKFKMK